MGGTKITQTEAETLWQNIGRILRAELGEETWASWLKPVESDVSESGRFRLRFPSRFIRDWVANHYGARIRELLKAENPALDGVRFEVRPFRRSDGPTNAPAEDANVPLPAPVEEAGRSRAPTHQVVGSSSWAESAEEKLSSPLDDRFSFENFVVGNPNEFAYAAARRVAENDDVAFNPLFLYSGVGLGKTHLMQAIARHIRNRDPNRTVIYMSAEKFMFRFVRALRYRDMMAFKEQFRNVDVLMIDDVQFISGKDSTQEEFFHTFNAIMDEGRQIVISADKSPIDLDGIQDRLRSRLGSGLVADIHPTTYELRLGILQAKVEELGVDVPGNVLEFLARKITSNVRELDGALRRLVAYANLLGFEITLDKAQEVLADMLRAHGRRITIEDIQRRVAEHFDIRYGEMSSARRARVVARPRQVAMYLAKQLTSRSLPEIGRKFGKRDHTTVMYAVSRVEALCGEDENFRQEVDFLRRMLET